MKSVLISIRPKWCELIANGKKTIEVRKTRPKLETPFKCYIYMTGVGGIIGEFVCDEIDAYIYARDFQDSGETDEVSMYYITFEQGKRTGLTYSELEDYGQGETLYGWHISDLKIYDKPMSLGEFHFPPEKYCERQLCGGCPKDQVMGLDGDYAFDCEWERPLTRPPQSWCYVEEVTP